jgi:hypothetical protein
VVLLPAAETHDVLDACAVIPAAIEDERPELVLRTSGNSVKLVEEHQLAEPLKNEIPRVIAENLLRLLGTKQVSVYPQSAGDQAEYRVLVGHSTIRIVARRPGLYRRALDGQSCLGGSGLFEEGPLQRGRDSRRAELRGACGSA